MTNLSGINKEDLELRRKKLYEEYLNFLREAEVLVEKIRIVKNNILSIEEEINKKLNE